jgi:cyclohexanecarboxyl-CoA dehydrogenase
MEFSFTEEQEMIRQTARKFALNELLPHSAQWDRTGDFPRHLLRKMADLGLVNTTIPPEYGGQGTDRVTNGIIVEELARGDFSMSIFAFSVMGDAFMLYGTEEQKREWLPPLAQGEKFIGIALTESESGSDAASLKMSAVRDGDEYVLNGEKSSTSLINAEAWLVLARTDPQASPARGISCFIVTSDMPGLTASHYNDLGGRAVPRGPLAFEDVRVPARNLFGEENRGFHLIMNAFDYNRALIGLMCIGTAQQALDETVRFAKERKSFGRVITTNQGVSFPISEAATYLELARLICYKVLWLRDNELPHTKEAAMAKWWVPRTCVDIIHECLLIHGHYGYTDEFPVAQRLREVIGWQIGDGTANIQKLIIAREVIGREYVV